MQMYTEHVKRIHAEIYDIIHHPSGRVNARFSRWMRFIGRVASSINGALGRFSLRRLCAGPLHY